MADTKQARKAPRSRTRHLELERRASWLVQKWNREPRLTYDERIELLCDKFDISERTAATIHARAGEIYRELVSDLDISRILNHQWDVYERALAAGKLAVARRTLFDMALVKGIAKPSSIVQIGNINVSHFAHVQVLQMTPVQRENRERELAEKERAALPAPVPKDVVLDVETPPERE